MSSHDGEYTLEGRPLRRTIFFRAVVVVGLVSLIAVGVFLLHPVLQEHELSSHPKQIIVVSFENQTGNRKLDHLRNVLQDAVITHLEQSECFQVTTLERMADILRQMGKGSPEHIDMNLGRDICRNVGAEVMVVGAFTHAGAQFQTSLELVDVNNLEVLKTFVSSGVGRESLLGRQIDQLADEIAQSFGVAVVDTTKRIRPTTETMTFSPEAYDFFLKGVDACDRMSYRVARRFLEKAVQKDSRFIMAWFWLGTARSGCGDEGGAIRARRQASSLADRGTEKEKFFTALYDSSLRIRLVGPPGADIIQFLEFCTKRFPLEKHFWRELGWTYESRSANESAIAALKKALELDPSFGLCLADLAHTYVSIGDLEMSVETYRRWAAASPGNATPYDGLALLYWSKGMYDEAITSFEQAIDVKPDWDPAYLSIATIRLHNEEYDQAFRWIDSAITRVSSPERKADAMWLRACCLHWLGRLKDEETELRVRDSVLARTGLKPRSDTYLMGAWIAYERGDFKRSRSLIRKWGDNFLRENSDGTIHQYLPELGIQVSLGFVDLKARQLDSVECRLSRMEGARSRALASLATEDSAAYCRIWKERHGLLAGYLQLARGKPREALALALSTQNPQSMFYAASCPTVLSDPEERPSQYRYIPMRHDLLPAAYAAMGNLDSAIAAYQRAVCHESTTFSPIVPLYHYRLARVYEQAGMIDKAISEYRRFLKIWGKADRIFKEPEEAKKRMARLKRAH